LKERGGTKREQLKFKKVNKRCKESEKEREKTTNKRKYRKMV